MSLVAAEGDGTLTLTLTLIDQREKHLGCLVALVHSETSAAAPVGIELSSTTTAASRRHSSGSPTRQPI